MPLNEKEAHEILIRLERLERRAGFLAQAAIPSVSFFVAWIVYQVLEKIYSWEYQTAWECAVTVFLGMCGTLMWQFWRHGR